MTGSSNIAAIEPPLDPLAAAFREAELFRITTPSTVDAGDAAAHFATADRLSVFANVFPGYQLIREIHRGGQGIVFQAVRESTGEDVAIKVLHDRAAAHPRELERFEREAAVLRDLNHPNIIAISEIGVAGGEPGAGGRPYLVMPYIAGWPLDEYVLRNGLSIRETLELFAKVCEAVNAAHLNGVIHRDLKPGNVRVDDAGEPHVLDFGLAKSTASPAGQTLTEPGQFIGSLPWASPELADPALGRVDLRTDVYSLGAVLFHLLTGAYPIDPTGSQREVLNRIVTAPPPSPRMLRREIDGEVETIVLKCLSKERERRYSNAGEVARDIRHQLADEAIDAKRDSAWYVLRKTLQRHHAPIAIAAAFLLLLAGGTVASTVLWQRAERESERAREESQKARQQAARAEAVNKFLQDMLSSVDPQVAQGRDTTLLREILDQAIDRIEGSASVEPEVEAAIRTSIGLTYHGLGLYAEAEPHLTRALDLRLQVFGEDHAWTLQALSALSGLYHTQGHHTEAASLALRAHESSRRIFGEEHTETLVVMTQLGDIYRVLGRFAEAEAYLVRAVESLRRDPDEQNSAKFMAIGHLARVYEDTNRGQQAAALRLESMAGLRRVKGELHPFTLDAMYHLARLYLQQGRHAEAERLFLDALDGQRRVFGPEHRVTLRTRGQLGELYLAQGRLDEADVIFRELPEVYRRSLGDDDPQTLGALTRQAIVLRARGRLEECVPLFEQMLAGWRRARGDVHSDTSNALANLGTLYRELKRFDEAESLLREALAVRRKVSGDDHPSLANRLNDLATLFQDKGDYPAAEPFLREALEIQRRTLPAGDPAIASGLALLASSLLKSHQFADAEVVLRECLTIRAQAYSDGHPQAWLRYNSMSMLGEALLEQSQFAETEPLLLESYEKMQPPPGPATEGRKREALERIVKLYEAWEVADPGTGKARQASDWRAKLDESRKTTGDQK